MTQASDSPAYMALIGIAVVVIVVAAGIALGTAERLPGAGSLEPVRLGIALAADPYSLNRPAGSSAARH